MSNINSLKEPLKTQPYILLRDMNCSFRVFGLGYNLNYKLSMIYIIYHCHFGDTEFKILFLLTIHIWWFQLITRMQVRKNTNVQHSSSKTVSLGKNVCDMGCKYHNYGLSPALITLCVPNARVFSFNK